MSLGRPQKLRLPKSTSPTSSIDRSPTTPRRNQPYGSTTWVYAKEFGNSIPGKLKRGTNITMCPNGNIVVADQMMDKVNIYNGKGKSIGCLDLRLHPQVVSLPWDIAVSAEGTYYITDLSQYVKVFDAKGKFAFQFPVTSPDTNTSSDAVWSDGETACLVGLTFDNNGTLLVGETEKKYISRHAYDGRHIKSIRVSIPPRFLSVTPDSNIIISPWENNTDVQVLNSDGHLLYRLERPLGVAVWETTGVCYRNGFIFVSNCCNGKESRGIYCFSLFGEYVGCATREVNEPHGLVVTEDGDKMLVINNIRIDGRLIMCVVKEFTMRSSS